MATAEPTTLLLVKADAQRALAEAHLAAGGSRRRRRRLRQALALDVRKGNLVAAAATRRLLAGLPG